MFTVDAVNLIVGILDIDLVMILDRNEREDKNRKRNERKGGELLRIAAHIYYDFL